MRNKGGRRKEREEGGWRSVRTVRKDGGDGGEDGRHEIGSGWVE